MTSRMRTGLAGVVGAVSAFVVVAVVEAIGHAVHAPATPADLATPAAMAAFVASLPVGAFLFVFAAYVLATLAGGLIAALVARRHAMRLALIVGGLILAGAAVNFVVLPHPAWFVVATLIGVPAAAWLAGRTGRRWAPA